MSPPTHRLFFALLPPPQLARRIAVAAERLPHRPLRAERLHMTMFLLDDRPTLDPALVRALLTVGEALEMAPIAIGLERLVVSPRSAALRPAGAHPPLVALHDEIARLADAAGITGREGYRFAPHVTLGYGAAPPSSERVAPIGWTADELVLIDSHIGRTRYDQLGRWRLAGAPVDQLALL